MDMEFLGIFLLILFSIILSTIISGASYIVSVKQPDSEKVSVYECGFDPFGSSRVPFSVKFFLVGILFLIFDLEISFLFPWCVVYNQIELFGF
jgi:NADH:ubiquinone oxidoreductase subunit 3 (subunit A)